RSSTSFVVSDKTSGSSMFWIALGTNNPFKPNPLRYAKHMADTACHVFRSTTLLGLTLVLGASHASSRTHSKSGRSNDLPGNGLSRPRARAEPAGVPDPAHRQSRPL